MLCYGYDIEPTTAHVKFVSYTGKYPNLCSGVLTLNIDGKEVKFGHEPFSYSIKENRYKDDNFDGFWVSGGGLDKDYYAYQSEWEIQVDEIPPEFVKYAVEIDKVFNDNVPHGCCGGCA